MPDGGQMNRILLLARKIIGRLLMVIAPVVAIAMMIQNVVPLAIAINEPGDVRGVLIRFILVGAVWCLGGLSVMVLGAMLAASGRRRL